MFFVGAIINRLRLSLALGIVIGVVGIGMVSVTYALYQKILKARKRKYSADILALSDELLNK